MDACIDAWVLGSHLQAAEFLAQALFLEAGNEAVATEVDTPRLLPGCLACVPAALSCDVEVQLCAI